MQETKSVTEASSLGGDLERTIWVSSMMSSSHLIKAYRPVDPKFDLDALREIMISNAEGRALSKDQFPSSYYWNDPHKKAQMPGHCMYHETAIISQKCADVFNSVDIGKTSLYPVKVYDHDKKTPIPGQYYSIDFGENKRGVILEKSKVVYRYGQYGAIAKTQPNSLHVNKSALQGVDLWVDDTVRQCVFMSGRLVAALRAARMDKLFQPTPCGIAE